MWLGNYLYHFPPNFWKITNSFRVLAIFIHLYLLYLSSVIFKYLKLLHSSTDSWEPPLSQICVWSQWWSPLLFILSPDFNHPPFPNLNHHSPPHSFSFLDSSLCPPTMSVLFSLLCECMPPTLFHPHYIVALGSFFFYSIQVIWYDLFYSTLTKVEYCFVDWLEYTGQRFQS